MPTNKELEKRVAELEALIERAMGIRTGRRLRPATKPEERADYRRHGSPEHMDWLGLRKVKEINEEDQMQYKSYEMVDITLFGLNVRPEFLRSWLVQKVNELIMPMPMIQSIDPFASGYAPPLWIPDEIPVKGIL